MFIDGILELLIATGHSKMAHWDGREENAPIIPSSFVCADPVKFADNVCWTSVTARCACVCA